MLQALVLVDQPALDELLLPLVLVHLPDLVPECLARFANLVPPILLLAVLLKQPDFEVRVLQVYGSAEGHVAEAVDAADLLREGEGPVVADAGKFPGTRFVLGVRGLAEVHPRQLIRGSATH